MKQSKFLAFLLMAVLTMGVFTACSDDDDDLSSVEKALIGVWEEEYNPYEVIRWELKKDHTATISWISEKNPDINETIYFKWSADDKYIFVKFDDGRSGSLSYTLEGNKLTYTDGEDTIIMYKKK